jgi:hypothetical protein
VSIDHLGMHEDGLTTLLRLVEGGVKVKATGFGRVELEPAETVSTYRRHRSERADGGHGSAVDAGPRRPFADADFTLIRQVLTPAEVDAVFWSNAAKFYGIEP